MNKIIRRIALSTILFLVIPLALRAQTSFYLHVSSAVEFIVTDPVGRKSGIDRRFSKPTEQAVWLQQIPNAVVDYENSNEGGPSIVVLESSLVTPKADGTYAIEMIGNTTEGSYLTVYVLPQVKGAQIQHPYFHISKIPIDTDSSVTYLFTYHGVIGTPVSLVKVVSARSLIQDVAAMSKLDWIKNQQTANKYLECIDTYRTQLQQLNFNEARTALSTIIQNIGADSARTLTRDACKSLRSDVELLLQQN
jgi:hypothetical protein